MNNVLIGTTDTSNSQKYVRVQKIPRKCLNFFWKCCGKHQSLSFPSWWHSMLFDYSTNLWLKAHIKHSISFIQDKKSDLFQTHFTPAHHIDKTPRGCNKKVTTVG
ncbi:unnamed protein product [Schistosoma margrebowiei]|uniref:Uncharacterized protein n=1 Tax=Schistosoma margrebowiei TaxID=48269 RepID=A0A3P7XFF8_9TREM|nr:unnamed protein product [Schistosoma margrebowiei]